MPFAHGTRRKAATAVLWLAILLLGAWLLHPALAPVHVEGFSASIVAIGLHMAHGTIGDFMPFERFNADYFGLTKFGAVIWVALLSPFFGGDGAMRLLMWAGLVLTWASTAYLVRMWTAARWWIIALVLLLMPGIAEGAFYFNDNLPAAGLLLAGLCILVRWPTAWQASIVAGLVIGCAISIRVDLVLVAVSAVPLILWPRGWRTLITMAGVSGASALLVLFAIFASSGVTPVDVLRVGSYAIALWDRPFDIARHLREFLFFIGLPNAALVLLGLLRLLRERRWHRLLLFCGVPLFFNLVMIGTLWQARQLIALAPFLGALVALAAETTVAEARTGRFVAPALFAAFALLVLAGPLVGVTLSDGPHGYIGRLSGITLWKDWQANVRRDFTAIDGIIGAAPSNGTLIVLTDGWNVDRYLHLRLIERGFRHAGLPSPCPMIGEAYRQADRTIVQLSLRTTFVPYWRSLEASRLQQVAVPCAAQFNTSAPVLLTEEQSLQALLPRLQPQTRLSEIQPSNFAIVTLDARSLAILGQLFQGVAETRPAPVTLEQARTLLDSRTDFSR